MNRDRQRGATAVFVAVMIFLLLAFVALAVDATYWMFERTRLQKIADASALSCLINSSTCTTGVANPNTQTIITNVSETGVSVQTTNTITCPAPAIQAGCVEAIASSVSPGFFGQIMGVFNVPLNARAVAGRVSGGAACVFADTSTHMQGNAQMNGTNCSFNLAGFRHTGAAYGINASGTPNGINLYNRVEDCASPSNCNVSPTNIPQTLSAPPATPQAANTTARDNCQTGCTIPTSGPKKDWIVCPNNTSCTFEPGTYTRNIDCSGANVTCTLNTGVYTLNGNVSGPGSNGSLVSGTGGVQIQLGNNANFNMGGGGRVALTALQTGTCSGTNDASAQIVIYSTGSGTITLQGNSGTGGASCQGVAGAGSESLAELAQRFAHWLAPGAQSAHVQAQLIEAEVPAQLWARIAPRGLLVQQAQDDAWANPAGTRALLARLAPHWSAAPERLVLRERAGGHAMTAADWQAAACLVRQALTRADVHHASNPERA